MIGKLAKVSRFAITVAVGGSSGCTREIAAFTYCNVWNISTFQSKNRSISAEPRLVIERTSSRPGTLFTPSSSRRVIGHHHLIGGHDSVINRDQNSGEVGSG